MAYKIKSAVLFGAGNLAWHLGHSLLKIGVKIVQVVNRSPEKGISLASELGSTFIKLNDHFYDNADIYILAISDDAVCEIIKSMKFRPHHFVIHCAGTLSMDLFSGCVNNYGVMYPLQTFTQGKYVDFKNVPLMIEGNSTESINNINELAHRLSNTVNILNSEKRAYLHIAAVIASNFSNQMLTISDIVLKETGLPFSVLEPLVKEMVAKAFLITPSRAITGPAARGNIKTINRHLELLKNYPDIKKIYQEITEDIMSGKHKNKDKH